MYPAIYLYLCIYGSIRNAWKNQLRFMVVMLDTWSKVQSRRAARSLGHELGPSSSPTLDFVSHMVCSPCMWPSER